MSPEGRSIRYATLELGWVAGKVSRWIPQARRSVDLWGWVDILAFDPASRRLWAIQATTQANAAARLAKAAEWPHMEAWVAAGHGAEVWAWAKRGKAGKRKLWGVNRIPISAQPAP